MSRLGVITKGRCPSYRSAKGLIEASCRILACAKLSPKVKQLIFEDYDILLTSELKA